MDSWFCLGLLIKLCPGKVIIFSVDIAASAIKGTQSLNSEPLRAFYDLIINSMLAYVSKEPTLVMKSISFIGFTA